MTFDHHAFISYAHIDNEPLTPGQKGWVAQFHATLQTMLSQRLGEKARIWRDDKLDGNDVFAQEIVDQFAKTALLISILSPRYVRSEWCTRELRAFCEAAALTGGVTVGNKSRIFKVVKTPVDAGAGLPEPVQQTLGYDFFAVEEGDSRELDPAFGEEARQQFLSKLSGLAWQIAKSLQQLAQAQDARAAAAPEARPIVFLAECGHDLRTTRDQLATDLQMHGYEVLPARQLPLTEEALVPELKSQLERCALSIHLVGRTVGPIPDGPSERSLAVLENELAATRCRQSPLRLIIWLPEGVTGERAEQQAFIDALQQVVPSRSELRYFRAADAAAAGDLSKLLDHWNWGSLQLRLVEGYESKSQLRQFEIWLARPDTAEIGRLFQQLNAASADDRKFAGQRLQDAYTASTLAVAEALKQLAAERVSALSASGRINMLYFLTRTAPLAWDAGLETTGRETVARLRRDAGQQTAAELQRLSRLLDAVRAGDPAPPAENRN